MYVHSFFVSLSVYCTHVLYIHIRMCIPYDVLVCWDTGDAVLCARAIVDMLSGSFIPPT